MNQTQLKYARERAAKTFTARKAALEKKFTTPAVKLTSIEKLEALKAGKFKIDTKTDQLRYGWDHGVTFPAEKPRKFDQKGFDEALAALTERYDALVGELVLGDNEAALALLKAFEADAA